MQLPEDEVKIKFNSLHREMLAHSRRRLPKADTDRLAFGYANVINKFLPFFAPKNSPADKLNTARVFKCDAIRFKEVLLKSTRVTFDTSNSVVICLNELIDELARFILTTESDLGPSATPSRPIEESRLDVESKSLDTKQGISPLGVESEQAKKKARNFLGLSESAGDSIAGLIDKLIHRSQQLIDENEILKQKITANFVGDDSGQTLETPILRVDQTYRAESESTYEDGETSSESLVTSSEAGSNEEENDRMDGCQAVGPDMIDVSKNRTPDGEPGQVLNKPRRARKL